MEQWRDDGAGPSEVRPIDPERREPPADMGTDDVDPFADEHDGWQPVRRRSSPPSSA